MTFQPTRWSLVLRAGGDDAAARNALEELCAAYWPPVYALYRREGLAPDHARDLTQTLFAELLARNDFARADPQKGSLRGYLRACARHLLANERDKARAQKRGHGHGFVPLDVDDEEARLAREPADGLDAAAAFERRWAQAVIEAALARLERDEQEAGRAALFAALRPGLEGASPTSPYAELAAALAMTEGALKVAAHRLRARFRDALLAEVRETLPAGAADQDAGDGQAELRELLTALTAARSGARPG